MQQSGDSEFLSRIGEERGKARTTEVLRTRATDVARVLRTRVASNEGLRRFNNRVLTVNKVREGKIG
jgi:hypothetical protein